MTKHDDTALRLQFNDIKPSVFHNIKLARISQDQLEGLPKDKLFTIDAGNNRGTLADIICPYSRRICRRECCGIWDLKNNQCAIITQAQNQSPSLRTPLSGKKDSSTKVGVLQQETEMNHTHPISSLPSLSPNTSKEKVNE